MYEVEQKSAVNVCNTDVQMENRRNMVEVLGVPEDLPSERTVEKLEAYFLSRKNGGGEVLEVLYPCYQPGQAFIIFEKPEVAACVVSKSHHMLKVDRQQYPLIVKAAESPKLDLPVEATIHLKNFPNKKMVPEILKSHDFTWTDLNSDQVRIKGSFSKLKDVNADLEKLHYQPRIPLPSSPVRNASSGAISKHYANNRSDVSDGKRSHLGYGDKPSPASPSLSRRSASFHSRPTSAFPQTRYQHMSHSQGTEFVVDADVFKYAERFRRKDIEVIMCNHNVTPKYLQVGNNINICLQGRSAKIAAGKLQSLLNDLSKSLRTQEVPLNHVVHDGKALLEKIRKDRDIYKSVLVCKLIDRVHLIGPSGESYELKQRLLGKPVDHSGRPGRTLGSGSRERSHSMPPPDRKTTERDIIANPSPGGVQGYSPTRYQSHEEDSDPDFLSSSCFGKSLTKRSKSLSRLKVSPEKSTDDTQDKKTKKANHVFSISPLIKLGTKNEIKQKMRSSKK